MEVVTPNSFLNLDIAKRSNFANLDGSELEMPNHKILIETLITREDLIEKFRESWFHSYLLSLRESSRDIYEDNWQDQIKVGDVVLIYSPVKSRIFWNLGRVVELLTGRDNKTRCVKLKRSDRSTEVHSVNLLYPLELSLVTLESTRVQDKVQDKLRQQPRRVAAETCKHKLKIACN